MKKLIVLFSLFLSVGAYAQGVTYLVDNQLSNYGLDSSKVFYSEVIKGDRVKKFINVNVDSVLIQNTKEYVTPRYQANLSELSKEYKEYIDSHQNDDAQVLYILNGGVEQAKSDALIRKLYLLTRKKSFTKAILVYRSFDQSSPTLLISTKD